MFLLRDIDLRSAALAVQGNECCCETPDSTGWNASKARQDGNARMTKSNGPPPTHSPTSENGRWLDSHSVRRTLGSEINRLKVSRSLL